MSKKVCKSKTVALVKWLSDGKHSTIQLNDLILGKNEELEINSVYDARWGNQTLRVELLFIGELKKCQEILENICENLTKSKKLAKELQEKKINDKKSTESESSVQEKLTQSAKSNVSRIDITKTTDEPHNDHNSTESNSKKSKKDKTPTDNLSATYLNQLEERNQLIEQLKTEKDKLENECEKLKEQLNLSKILSDSDFTTKIVEVGLQIVKHLASSSQKEEIRKFCLTTGQIVLHSSYPTVSVSQIQYDKFLLCLNTKKTSKSIFKSIMVALIPDWSVWGSQNAENMRTKYSPFFNATRDFLQTKNVILSESDFKTSVRDLCTRGKKELKKSENMSTVLSTLSTSLASCD